MKLSDIMTQVRGLSYDKKDATQQSSNNHIPLLRAGNIQKARINFDDLIYVPKSLVKEKQILKKGDMLIAASSGSISVVGKAAMVEKDEVATFGAFCKVLRPAQSKVDLQYFKFFFETNYYKRTIQGLAAGANINNLKTEHFDDLEIPLPPLPEQRRIASILDAADRYREGTRALLAQYELLVQSVFLEMFGDVVRNERGWEVRELENVCSKISVGFVGTCEPFYCGEKEGIPMIRTGNLGEGFLKHGNLKYVTQDFHAKQKKSQLHSGDILIARHGDNGKAVLYKGEFPEANCLNIVILRPGPSLLSIYVQFLLNNESTRKKITGRTGGATQKVVNTKEIQKLDIPIPPLPLQQQFAERVRAIEAQKALVRRSLEEAEGLFGGLLGEAFGG